MNMRSRRLTAHRRPERIVRNLGLLQEIAQPNALFLIGIQRDIDTAAVVKSQRSVKRRFTTGTDGQRSEKLSLKRSRHPRKIGLAEHACAVIPLDCAAMKHRWSLVQFAFDVRLGCEFLDQVRPEPGQIQRFLAELQVFDESRQGGARDQPFAHQFLGAFDTLRLPRNQPLGRADHQIALLFREVFDPQRSIERAPEDRIVLGIRQFGLSLVKARSRNRAGFGHRPEAVHFKSLQLRELGLRLYRQDAKRRH
jgi:hypothetical protein